MSVNATARARSPRNRGAKARKKPKLSRVHRPQEMSLEQWQAALRRQFGREQAFVLTNLGSEPVFSDFRVVNPSSGGDYRVTIRGAGEGENFCTCPDFTTNTLGTCKHVEFVLARLERKPGARRSLRAGYKPPFSEVILRYGATREVRFRPGVECPDGLAELARKYFDPAGVLRPDAFARFEKFVADSQSFEHELRVSPDVLAFVAELRDGERRRRRVDEAFHDGVRSKAFDGLLKVELYDYQREGALFAARAGRALIADEMGLGKTVQAIAAAEIMARRLGVTRVLVVCPTSLKHQWEREITRFADRPVTVIGGLRPARQQAFADDSFFKITNYDTVHRDLDLIADWGPDLVILDEAQRIKNWSTRVARSVKRVQSPYAIVLTGTPLENRLEELVSIVQFVDQHRIGPTFRFLADHQVTDDIGRVVGYRDLDSIGRTLAPVLVRRRKSDVLGELPERLDKNFFVPMTPEQRRHHDENREIVTRIVAKWRRHKFLSEADQRRLMIALQNMRMSCNSTYLLDPSTDHGVKTDELATLLAEQFERPDTKAVVFSQWVRTHELIERRLKGRGFGHVLFHGGVPGGRRKALVDRFRDDPDCRAFLATDAGGVGLNLQHASLVVNMDLPWNPAVLEQRIGRVHRLGQRRPVHVVNFVAQGTIEESMLSLLKFKKSLFGGALDGGEKEIFLGGTRLTRFMESVDKTTSTIPTPAAPEEPEPSAREPRTDGAGVTPAPIDPPPPQAGWTGLLDSAAALLGQLAAAARSSGPDAPTTARADSVLRRDPATGKPYLHLPLPDPQTLDRLLASASELIRGLSR